MGEATTMQISDVDLAHMIKHGLDAIRDLLGEQKISDAFMNEVIVTLADEAMRARRALRSDSRRSKELQRVRWQLETLTTATEKLAASCSKETAEEADARGAIARNGGGS